VGGDATGPAPKETAGATRSLEPIAGREHGLLTSVRIAQPNRHVSRPRGRHHSMTAMLTAARAHPAGWSGSEEPSAHVRGPWQAFVRGWHSVQSRESGYAYLSGS
jgi:hypothetical protein